MDNPERTFDYAIKTEYKFTLNRRTVGMVEFHYTNGETELFAGVNGGIAWPTIEAPGYFCVFGQRSKENQFGKKPLVQLFELEDSEGNINNFFKEVCVNAERFKVYSVFGNAEDEGFYKKATSLGLYIPLKLTGMGDFNYGLEIVKAWFKTDALAIMEDSILKQQLSSLRETELREAADQYNAINGLRYVVTGFDDWTDGRPTAEGPLGMFDPESMAC